MRKSWIARRGKYLLEHTTPVILTFDEAANIERTLAPLYWARDIVIVDSGSTDDTLDIVSQHPKARVIQRTFDNHAAQWNFAITETGIQSDWILALDADHVVTEEFVRELALLTPPESVNAYRVSFKYCALGHPLRGSLYPPLISLYRRGRAHYVQQGHTQRLIVDGEIVPLESSLLHDDRKSFSRWLRGQNRYMRLEADLIRNSPWKRLSRSNRLRMLIVPAPFLALLWSLIVKRTILDGIPGVFYGVQRMIAEFILSFHLISRFLR